MSENATQIIEWEGTDGSVRSLLYVVDETKDSRSIEYERFELCKLNQEEDSWETIEEIDYIDEIISFGIPKNIVD